MLTLSPAFHGLQGRKRPRRQDIITARIRMRVLEYSLALKCAVLYTFLPFSPNLIVTLSSSPYALTHALMPPVSTTA